MNKEWKLTDPDLPENLWPIRETFLEERKKTESLHDYLTRKGIRCFCKPCYTQYLIDKKAKLL